MLISSVLFLLVLAFFIPSLNTSVVLWLLFQFLLYLAWQYASWKMIQRSNFIFQLNDTSEVDLDQIKPKNNSENRMFRLLQAIQFRTKTNRQMEQDIGFLTEETSNYSKSIKEIKKSIKKLNYELSLSVEINQYIVNQADHFMVEIDENGIILKMNALFDSRLGYRVAEYVGKSFNTLIQKSDMEPKFSIEELINAKEEPVFINLLYRNHQNDASEYVSFKSVPLSGNRFLCIGKSISDEIGIQSRIIRKKKELDYINQINSALISNRSVEELLENILKKLEGLFNMSFGCVYMLDQNQNWELKTYLSRSLDREEFSLVDIDALFEEEWLRNPQVKVFTLTEQNSVLIDYAKYVALAPLEVEGKVIAIMCAGLVSKVNITDYNVLKMFNNQASIVVQRAIIYEKLRLQYFNTIEALVSVIEAKDKYTEGHSRRVSRFAVEIARKIGYSNEEIENVEISGLLHDVGKIGIDQKILTKRGRLTNEEYDEMKLHPEKGIQVLNSIQLREDIRDGILYHHLRYDLKGYPPSEKEILPEFAAIIGAADAFDAITSARSYSKASTIEDAMAELIRYRGSQFAPKIVDTLEELALKNRAVLQKIIDDESQGENYVIPGTLQTVASTGL
jgi:HD-GYP domain-containing protein (c-di-GMP phosphodiesterase class II)